MPSVPPGPGAEGFRGRETHPDAVGASGAVREGMPQAHGTSRRPPCLRGQAPRDGNMRSHRATATVEVLFWASFSQFYYDTDTRYLSAIGIGIGITL